MQKLQDSVFNIVKTTNLSPAVFSYLQPSDNFPDKTPLGGILSDTKHGWLALGPKFCVVDLRTGLKVAQRTFGASLSNFRTTVTCVVELPTPLTNNSQQLIISLECEDIAGMICIFHINGSQLLRCIQTEVVVTQLAVCDGLPDGPFTCFDGAVMAGTKSGEIFVFDLNRSCLIQALKNISQGYEHLIRSEESLASISFLPLNAVHQIEAQRDLALEIDDHIAVLLNDNSLVDGQYIFRNPDGTVRMKAKRDHIRVTVVQYIPQLGSLAVGFNFGAFQIWNLLNLDLEFTSQVNVECLPVTQFGFQEPCDDPRAFCYLWVVFSVIDRMDEEEFPLAVMYSLTYQGKRMLSDTKCLYQDFLTATVRFQVELSTTEENSQMVGGRCVSCHTYSVNSMLGGEGEDSMLNICQLVWECWGDSDSSPTQYGMLLFDLDQWYKDQMPATYQLQSTAFMSATQVSELSRGACATLDVRLVAPSVSVYCAATRLEEHFYPNSLRYDCICLNTSEACVLSTTGIQRQIINSLDQVGPTALLNPTRLYHACIQTGLVPLYLDNSINADQEEQRRYLLSVALEARLSRFLKRCAHDWATGSHIGAGCTLTFLVDWCWKRAIDLKENARELTAPLFTSSTLPDRNVVRCLEHCVQQLTQLSQLLDAVLTKCCNLVVPEALSEMEEKYKGIGTVSLYFQVVQWFLRVGLLPDRLPADTALPYPLSTLYNTYTKRRLKLHRLQERGAGPEGAGSEGAEGAASQPCALLYIDQLIEQEFGGDRIHEMWVRGGSECGGLYPPPSLYSLLRLYLLPDVAETHKHSLVLYLLVDYSMVYDEVRYEAVIRRLMQFPTMFGLSNTAIKATQAFWHLDHRDFDFALDQLQCLTGNTLSDWQHNVVLSSLLAQKKTQAALQYLHVRKPAPIQSNTDSNSSKSNDSDKLDDWESCCNLYLARGLVHEAFDVIRTCVQNATSVDDKVHVLNFFFKGCRNTGHLSKILQVSLLPFEEEVFIRYLENCNESQTSDVLIMYLLQQARYLEAEQYNNRFKHSKPRIRDVTASAESLADTTDRDTARDTLVEVLCSTLPAITSTVARTASDRDIEPRIYAPKPMSVYVQARSPKNMFTYKSSFIQDTIENASETWINKPKARRAMKRALNIEDTPFICTPKLSRSKTIFNQDPGSESTPPKRARLNLTGTPKTPRNNRGSEKISQQLSLLLDMPEIQSPDMKMYDRQGAETPHSILKTRGDIVRDATSPVDSRYLADSDDELLETASNHTHYSDSTNKHLRFTIPTESESGSTPSPLPLPVPVRATESERSMERSTVIKERDVDMSLDSFVTTQSHSIAEPHPLESPPKKQATEERIHSRKSLKDTVKGRLSLSISANSSLSDDPNTSVESIADLPITLINPRYSGHKRRSHSKDSEGTEQASEVKSSERDIPNISVEVPKTPSSRRGIRAVSLETTPTINRSRSITPDRLDSPVVTTPLRPVRSTRSRSRTPEISPRSSSLAPIPELPKQEVESEPHPTRTTLSVPRALRSRSRTPERIEKVLESPRLEAITESPTKTSDSPTSSPTRRNLRSRSRTPEVEVPEKPTIQGNLSPRALRSRSKTPEKLLSPKKEGPKSARKPLSRLVLEANAIAASRNLEKHLETPEEVSDSAFECTPMKALKSVPSLMDVTISPIASKSVLQSSHESLVNDNKSSEASVVMKSLPAFTINETKFGKSVLHSYESSVTEITHEESETKIDVSVSKAELKSLPGFTVSESYFEKSVLKSYESSVVDTSSFHADDKAKDDVKEIELKNTRASTTLNISDFDRSVLGSHNTSLAESQDKSKDIASMPNVSSLMTSDSEIDEWKADKRSNQDVIQKEKEKIVEIEREIIEIENEMSDDVQSASDQSDEMAIDTDEMSVNTGDEEEDQGEEEDVGEEVEGEELDEEGSDADEASSDDSVISIIDSDESSSTSSDQSTPEMQQDIRITTVELENVVKDSKIEDVSNSATDKIEDTEESTDPLNQAQFSLLTDDNSIRSIQSETGLHYSDEISDKKTEDNNEDVKDVVMSTDKVESEPIQIEIAVEVVPPSVGIEKDEITNIPEPTTVPIETEKPFEKPQEIPIVVDVVDMASNDELTNKNKLVTEIIAKMESTDSPSEATVTRDDILVTKDDLSEDKTDEVPIIDVRMVRSQDEITQEIQKPASRTKRTKSTSSNKSTKETTLKNIEPKTQVVAAKTVKEMDTDKVEENVQDILKPAPCLKRTQSASSNKSTKDSVTENLKQKMSVETAKFDIEIETNQMKDMMQDTKKPEPRSKRTKSTSSNKSTKQIEVENVEQVKLQPPVETAEINIEMEMAEVEETVQNIKKSAPRSKRTKSTSSNKSTKQIEVENVEQVKLRPPVETAEINIEMKMAEIEETVQNINKSAPRSKRTKSTSSNKSTKQTEVDNVEQVKLQPPAKINIEMEKEEVEETIKMINKPAPRSKRTKSTSSNKSSKQTEVENVEQVKLQPPIEAAKINIEMETDEVEKTVQNIKKPEPRSKRAKSTSSDKSTRDIGIENAELKSPVPIIRSQSTASKSPEDKNSEGTPRRRAKTPTSTERRLILTRRVSKELSEKLDDSQASIEDATTPRRRSTRTRSKAEDDNVSIASGSSVKSTRSKVSEDAGDVKARRGRKSVLATKPDLSVIPETLAEESTSKAELKEDIISNYSINRRLTRHQKSVLESWLDPKLSTPRRAAAARHTSTISEQSHEDDDASSTHSSAFNVEPIDRMTLMNKEDFDGSPDPSEVQSSVSPESIASNASKLISRRKRAASEAKSTPKAATKITRRLSVDIEYLDTNFLAADSPTRSRRASFNRACEALLTPKGKRTSTELRKAESDSQTGSPQSAGEAPETPRRARRASNASLSKADTSRRTRKLSAVEENKDTNK